MERWGNSMRNSTLHGDVGFRIVQEPEDRGREHLEHRFGLCVLAAYAMDRGAIQFALEHGDVALHFRDCGVGCKGVLVADPESRAVETSSQGIHGHVYVIHD